MRNDFGSRRFLPHVAVAVLALTASTGFAVSADFQVELSAGLDARVAVHVGDVVTLTLPIKAVTGHSWILAAPVAPGLDLIGQRRELVDAGTVGGAQRQIEQFRANQTGRHTLTFVYRRPWVALEAADPAAKVTISVE